MAKSQKVSAKSAKEKAVKQEPTEDEKVEAAIDHFHRKMQALSALSQTQLKHAADNQSRERGLVVKTLEEARNKIETNKGRLNAIQFAHVANAMIDCGKSLEAFATTNHEEMLAEILFVSGFSHFDAYLHQVLPILYWRPKVLANMEAKEVLFADVLRMKREEIIAEKIGSELDSMLRESYSKIFVKLATRFGISTLTEFPSWATFIECSQRRHILVHCDGKVGQQYMDNCKQEGAKINGVSLGQKLKANLEYLIKSIGTVTEVGLKLGQILWRVSDGTSIAHADNHLGNLLFELLKREEWGLASRMGDFGRILAKRRHASPRNEKSLKVIIINHAQAEKWSGNDHAAREILGEFDWSGSAFEFQLAVACLRGDWHNAAKLMVKIGPDDSALPVHGYVGWPVFREFRNTPQFLDAFRTIFGVEFASELNKVGDESKSPHPPRLKKGRKNMPVDPARK